MQLDLDHLRGWIGREDQNSEMLTQASVDRFEATFDRTSRYGTAALPLLFHFCLSQPMVPTAELGADGHPARGGFLPPVPLPRRMWAGGAIDFHSPLRIGEIVTRRSVVEDVAVKRGRTGTLCFVTVRHAIESDGRLVLTERQDIVYRDAVSPPTPDRKAVEKAPVGESSVQVDVTAAFLFRYSALTFNSHRIHYDAPYSHEEEHYPGLVVHGPLQATMLCQHAADWCGAAPKRFRFRSLAPVFGPGMFTVNASSDGNTMKLWTARNDGSVGMEATAEW
ncbi:FAS1-like dehydratase domain-containing protein [Rhizobium glycinendophyticum]|uniref:Protein dehydratase n=1 Tax=Rhizobium glycinendophyticum TaxID=2589807 RepID=A0A504TQF3_9HYPH|nr:MaoC family dehydratase N-terminal domain-containing protein [Rhizobium glycinendophyticum]TPP05008.1 protein dehydratase [Rhizobium glycinendophyticum]